MLEVRRTSREISIIPEAAGTSLQKGHTPTPSTTSSVNSQEPGEVSLEENIIITSIHLRR
jgi:hypothetical protein